MIARTMMVCLAGLLMVGCAPRIVTTSIEGGEAKVFERPEYAVRGATPYDQNWIDSQIEGGVAAFGWPRPAPRPPELDAKPSAVKAKGRAKSAAAPKPIRGIIYRMRDRISGLKPEPPVEFVGAPIVPAVAPAARSPAPAAPVKRDAVDELLDIDPPIRRFQ